MLRKSTNLLSLLIWAAVTFGYAVGHGTPARADDDTAQLLQELSDPASQNGGRIAERVMEIWANSGSRTATYLYQRGFDAAQAQNFEAALEHLSAAIDHAPHFGQAYFSRGTIYFQIDEYGLALEDLIKAVSYHENHFEAYFGIAMVLEAMDESEAALAALRQSYALNPHRENLTDFIERLKIEVEGHDT